MRVRAQQQPKVERQEVEGVDLSGLKQHRGIGDQVNCGRKKQVQEGSKNFGVEGSTYYLYRTEHMQPKGRERGSKKQKGRERSETKRKEAQGDSNLRRYFRGLG